MKIKKFFTLLVLTGLVFSCSSDDDPEPVQPPVQSTEANILTFTLTDQTGPATINASAATVEIEVENGTDLSSLSPAFTVSAGASASPASGTSGDYSSQVTITVTAEDGTTTKAWSVDVSEATADVESSDTDILTFSLPEETGGADIDDTAHTIAIEVANGTDLTMLTPTFTISDGATADPASGTLGDYSSEVTITVTAEDGTTQDWTVNVTEASGGGGTTTVEFGDGGVKATAIRNLVVDGVTYDVEFRFVYPQQIYGNYPGTYTFKTNDDAITATEAVNAALNNTDAATVGEEGLVTDEGRYRIGYLSFLVGPVENTRFKTGIFEPASWRTGLEETTPYNAEPITFAVFTQLQKLNM